ncbi:MAG: cell surface protein SprA, partial [Flavobacteriales bacterium]|nr:cell surface protein SprA [Flavobacteriales bacterium]
MCKYFTASIITVIFLFLPSYKLCAQSATEKVEYDSQRELYILRHIDIFGRDVQLPRVFSREEWMDYLLFSKEVKPISSLPAPADTVANEKGIHLDMESPFLKNIFGGTEVKILPKGTLEGGVGVSYTHMDNPLLGERARRHTSFDISQAVGLDVIGTVGKKVTLSGRVSSADGFFSGESFSLTYSGDKHEILQKLTVGQVNIAMSSPYFSKTSDAFGVTATARVGRVWVDAFFAQKKDVAVVSSFDRNTTANGNITAADYINRRVFSLSKYFVENYNVFLEKYPMINSPIRITEIEVWVGGGSSAATSSQRFFALTDLAEASPYNTAIQTSHGAVFPDNAANVLFSLVKMSPNVESLPSGMTADDDYLVVDNARLLSPAEYTLHPTLGYIILKNTLPEGASLAVSFRYTAGGKTYTVGAFSTEKTKPENPLITKLITPTHTLPTKKAWAQMMKNAYSVSSPKDIEILFYDAQKASYLNSVYGNTQYAGQKISSIVGADRLNANGDATENNAGDGYVDAVEGVTFFSADAVLVFPSLYPFAVGRDSVLVKDEYLKSKYSYLSLYSQVKTVAHDDVSKNKYIIKTQQEASSVPFSENQTLLKNESGVSTRMAGIGLRYYPNEKTTLYASVINATTVKKSQKNYINDASSSKTQIAVGAQYSAAAPWLTRWADALSAQRLTAQSRITLKGDAVVQAEKTRKSSTISGENAVLIDDFESKGTGEDLSSPSAWVMSSTPMSSPFVPIDKSQPLAFNYKRAAVSWYTIDPIFYGNDSRTPENIRQDRSLTSKDNVRRVYRKEIFPMEDTPENTITDIATLDMYYRPMVRGAYNVNYSDMTDSAQMISPPQEHWAGIMRSISQTDIHGSGLSNIHIWVMYPYGKDVDKNIQYGRLVIDVGEVSEDIFSVGEKFDESDVNTSELKKKNTPYGYAPYNTPAVTSFSADEAVMRLQDVGLNGMDNDAEAQKYGVGSFFSPSSAVYQDPAGDDYRYFKSSLWDAQGADILTRYTLFNNTQGNTSGITAPKESYSVRATGATDAMDYNRDGVLSTAENYSA